MSTRTKVIWGIAAAGILAMFVVACGGGSKSSGGTSPTPTTPSPPTPTTPSPDGGSTGTPTITIANNAVSPKNITVTRGSRVTFFNNDNQSHDMQSDPHPVHTDCQEINPVGLLSPGQSRQTGTFNTARTCGYHDHNRDMVESLQGTITVQ